MVWGGAHFIIREADYKKVCIAPNHIMNNSPYNLINVCCLFDKRAKHYDDLSCTLETILSTLHSNLTTLFIVSCVTSQPRHRLLPSTFPRSYDVAMFIIRHSSKGAWLKCRPFY